MHQSGGDTSLPLAGPNGGQYRPPRAAYSASGRTGLQFSPRWLYRVRATRLGQPAVLAAARASSLARGGYTTCGRYRPGAGSNTCHWNET
jgi:hypothetical protein